MKHSFWNLVRSSKKVSMNELIKYSNLIGIIANYICKRKWEKWYRRFINEMNFLSKFPSISYWLKQIYTITQR